MKKHLQILAILNIAWGSFFVLGALIILFIFGGIAGLVAAFSHDADAFIAIPILGLFGGFLAMLLLLLSIPSIIVGIGLLKMKPWARTVGIVVSALHLFSVPLGTALGIYGLWVLFSSEIQSIMNPSQGPLMN
jgi:hypothetical protein